MHRTQPRPAPTTKTRGPQPLVQSKDNQRRTDGKRPRYIAHYRGQRKRQRNITKPRTQIPREGSKPTSLGSPLRPRCLASENVSGPESQSDLRRYAKSTASTSHARFRRHFPPWTHPHASYRKPFQPLVEVKLVLLRAALTQRESGLGLTQQNQILNVPEALPHLPRAKHPLAHGIARNSPSRTNATSAIAAEMSDKGQAET